MQKYLNNVANTRGDAIAGALVTVTTLAGAAATLFIDNGVIVRVTPLTTDANGYFEFYAADGRYTLTITKIGISTITVTDILLEDPADGSAALAGSSGAALVGFIQSGAGAVPRTVQDKERERVSVADYRQSGDTDDVLSHQRAIDALPASGGKITVADGAYVIATAPNFGMKNIIWEFGPNVSYSGAGAATFPRMVSNTHQLPVGPYILSRSTEPSPASGGIAAFNVEMIQPVGYNGQSVAIYAGSKGSSASGNVWTFNPLITADPGAGGTYQCIEVDVNCYSASALVKGISISGIGSANPDVGLEIVRADATLWDRGVDINNATDALLIRGTGMSRGIVIGSPTNFATTLLTGKQTANNADSVILQRNTDTSPTGYFLRAVDAANSISLLSLDVLGVLRMSNRMDIGTLVGLGSDTTTIIKGRQSANNADSIILQRQTDTSPTGNLLRGVNAANNATLFSVDISGNAAFVGLTTSANIVATGNITGNIVTGANLRTTVGANSVAAGTLCLGGTTSGTATAGAATLPANPLGFLVAFVGSTQVRIPYYNT